jgi:Putative stress-induced transcription regulator
MVVTQRAGELPEISPAPGMLEVVRQFVNTLDIESGTDELDSPRALLGWLGKSGLGGIGGDAHAGGRPVTEADLALAISLREALRGVLSWHVTAGNEPGASASPDRRGGRAGTDNPEPPLRPSLPSRRSRRTAQGRRPTADTFRDQRQGAGRGGAGRLRSDPGSGADPADRGGSCHHRDLGPAQGLQCSGLPVGLLRPLPHPDRMLVLDARLRLSREVPRLPAPRGRACAG